MVELIIARHGNTFEPGEPVLRVGRGTDLPLSASGRAQATALGEHLAAQGLVPDQVFCSRLQRTRQTAELALAAMGVSRKVEALAQFDEVDYGEDEGQPEEAVVARLGEEALRRWDEECIVPAGWRVDIDQMEQDWRRFASTLPPGRTLVVTSNGVARFAPVALSVAGKVAEPKLKTAAYGRLVRKGDWQCAGWNLRA